MIDGLSGEFNDRLDTLTAKKDHLNSKVLLVMTDS